MPPAERPPFGRCSSGGGLELASATSMQGPQREAVNLAIKEQAFAKANEIVALIQPLDPKKARKAKTVHGKGIKRQDSIRQPHPPLRSSTILSLASVRADILLAAQEGLCTCAFPTHVCPALEITTARR